MDKNNSKNLKIVCVSNNIDVFNEVINSNPYMNKYDVTMYDNTTENVGISKRYNDFIEKNITPESDFWVVFCHQDFAFNEDPTIKISKLSKNSIYGATGVKVYFSIKKLLKSSLSKKIGFYPSFRINIKGLLSKSVPFLHFKKNEPTIGAIKRTLLGRINQGTNNAVFKKNGRKVRFTPTVSSLDCCCLIVHSSLISENNLKFDENLDWHMYVEDFCLNCVNNHSIKPKVVQFDCNHLGIGTLNEDFYKSFEYVKQKYNLKSLKTTCVDG